MRYDNNQVKIVFVCELKEVFSTTEAGIISALEESAAKVAQHIY
jgi:hypothetical protein